MMHPEFSRFHQKLSRNVYGSLKGRIRLELLEKDIRDCCVGFTTPGLSIIDVGCGEGAFAARCLDAGHTVSLIDVSPAMIETALDRVAKTKNGSDCVRVDCADFLTWEAPSGLKYDIVLMHGAAEWMTSAPLAIERAAALVKPGGYLSLLMFNRDMHTFKMGVNGHLLGHFSTRKQKMFPPNALGVHDTADILSLQPGKIILQSGIRIFYGFFRELARSGVSAEQWMAQERAYYRQLPFSRMGQHSHFIWQKDI
ncbi:MAG: methyltransferase domain-containing protein [Deltaproteobacteria bacterium]|nr:methyltransferase domain-containing protein [Deltaproteobacteria bacterium]